MNNILSCDTSTGTLHLALKSDGRMYERMLESFSHSEGLLGQILSILGEAGIGIGDLGLLVCTRGPGSFTSLRIGMATLKGFSLARNIPLVSVPTLEAIAAACPCPGCAALAVIDAKKRRYYLGLYRDGQRLMDDVDGNAGDIADRIAEERNIIVGAINIRHELNDYLLRFGGHIGDGIRPDERRKGYATKMIQLGLQECQKLGIKKVLMICDKDNIGSARSIISNGGVLENEVNHEGAVMQRYWITL